MAPMVTMEAIEIKNLKTETPVNPWDFIVDSSSVLGNPFTESEINSRDDVCRAYRIYFYNRINAYDVIIMDEIRRLYKAYRKHGRLNLFCWEAPKTSHANTIRDYLYVYISSNTL